MAAIVLKWVVFILASILAIFSSIMMVTRRNPVHSALWLVVTFISLAVLYFLLNATFIAISQVIVYAGAIMMLFLFVIMLIHVERGPEALGKLKPSNIFAIVLTMLLFIEVAIGIYYYRVIEFKPGAIPSGDVKSVGSLLYTKYLFPFEIASILLLVGIVGAVVLAKRRK
ncbi:MAG: NADH-quinone oxidoreductase subunit J [Desulfobacterota bacterium]|nr:NADH-quinone oxidoreductase subunit J [Thermodesulfobacteriota bacterium]MDW8001854.1 NADH-quinone oxidoreductase subunit J [Deltaproteobacteria bacterium]